MNEKKDDFEERPLGEPGAQAEEGAEPGASIEEIPEEEIRRLAGELEAKTKEAAENHERFLRARADLENFRKRTEKEKADIRNFANEDLIVQILPVIDNLERALEHAEGGMDSMDSLKEGVRLTIDQMFGVLRKFGLEEVKAEGEKFDPVLHHAISHDDHNEAEPDTVIEVFQKGYALKGRLIRPSMVSVARSPAGEKDEEGA